MSGPIETEAADRRATWGAVALLGGLGGLTAWRIMSYATGQDPRIYLQLAEEIRAGGYSLAAIGRCAHWVVPGYPLLLAAVLDTLGIFAAYWINLPIFCAGMWLLARVLRRFASPAETLVAMLVFFWIAVTGHPLNPHFLFLPFRGVLEWAWMFGALALWLPAADPALAAGRRARRAAGTALWLMAGAVFRETIVFLVVPFGLIGLWQGVRGDRGAWKALAALLAPLVLAALGLVAWKWLQQEPLLNSQARMWLKGLKLGGFAKPFPVLLEDIVRLIATELGVVGGIGLAAGTGWAFVRREKTVFALWATALLLVLFYAVYKSHVRYTLSAVGLLALVAGWGFAATLSTTTRRFGPAGRRVADAAAGLVFVALLLRAIAGLETWGPRVTRADVRALQAHPVAAEPFVFVEKDNRHLVDALLAFTGASPKDPAAEGVDITRFAGALFLRPLDDKGRTAIKQGVTGEDWLKNFFDLEPVAGEIALGDSRSEVCRLTAWSRPRVTYDLAVAPGPEAGVLWLDFRAGNGAEAAEVELRGGADVAARIEVRRPAGLVPTWVAPGLRRAGRLQVAVQSSAPLPADLDPVFVSAGAPRWFRLEQGRRPSAMRMLGGGFEEQPLLAKHGAAWRTNAVLRLPALAGAPPETEIEVTLRLMPRPASSADIRGMLTGAAAPEDRQEWRIPAGREHREAKWRGTVARLGEPPELVLAADPLPEDCWYLRVEQMGIAFTGGE